MKKRSLRAQRHASRFPGRKRHSGWYAIEKTGIVEEGTFSATRQGFGFFIPQDESRAHYPEDILIPQGYTGGAMHGDLICVSLVPKSIGSGRKVEYIARVLRVLRRAKIDLFGTVDKLAPFAEKKGRLFSMRTLDSKDSTSVFVVDTAGFTVAPGQLVRAQIVAYPKEGRSEIAVRIVQVFGEADSLAANYAALLQDAAVPVVFSQAVQESAKRSANQAIVCGDRLDLREKLIFTIDGADAKDLDDAISLEKTETGYLLGVHIADVSHYVPGGSATDAEAYLRGNSIYFVDQVVPMLPQILSNGACSLQAGAERYALSAMITLDRDGAITGCTLHESVICSAIRGVYSELNDVLQQGSRSAFYPKYALLFPKTLPTMVELYEILAQKHRSAGALDFETPESQFILGPDGTVQQILPVVRGTSERLIEQFMLCANEAVAAFLHSKGLPCIYRVHAVPDQDRMQAFILLAHACGLDVRGVNSAQITALQVQHLMAQAKQKNLASALDPVLLRSLAKAKYASTPSGHFGLATAIYCHFTSPIRRYSDLCVHRIVKAFLHEEDIENYRERATEIAQQCSACENRAQRITRDIEDLCRVLYMQRQLGQYFVGTVSSVHTFGFFVMLENTCEGFVPIETLSGIWQYDAQRYSLRCKDRLVTLGQKIRVRLVDADIVQRRILLEPKDAFLSIEQHRQTGAGSAVSQRQRKKRYTPHQRKR